MLHVFSYTWRSFAANNMIHDEYKNMGNRVSAKSIYIVKFASSNPHTHFIWRTFGVRKRGWYLFCLIFFFCRRGDVVEAKLP